MANQLPYPGIVQNNQHYCVCTRMYVHAACGEFARASGYQKRGAWAALFSTGRGSS